MMSTEFRAIIAPNNWPVGTLTGGDPLDPAGFPIGNLLYRQPQDYYKTANGITDLTLYAQTTGDVNVDLSTVGLLYANVHNTHASVKIRGWQSGDDPDVDTPVVDSSLVFDQLGADSYEYALRYVSASSQISYSGTSLNMSGSFTLEAVVRTWYAAGEYSIFEQTSGGTNPRFVLTSQRKLRFVYSGGVDITSDEILDDFTWTHVAVVFDSGAQTVTLYINGTAVKQQGSVIGPLGNVAATDAEMFSPGLDLLEFRGWTVARSATDIYNNAFKPIADTAGLGTYLKLDEGSGATLNDTAAAGPGATQSGCYWMYPDRFWMSPELDDIDRTHCVWFKQFGAQVSQVKIDIRDEQNDEGFISIGNLLMSSAFQPSMHIAYGSTPYGYSDPGTRTVATDGVVHISTGKSFQKRQLIFETTSTDEIYQTWYRFFRGLGNSHPFLFIEDYNDVVYRFQKTIYGVFDGDMIPSYPSFEFFRIRVNMLELI